MAASTSVPFKDFRGLILADSYKLYLIRHGVADARGDAWPDDTKRPLTQQGMAKLQKTMRGLAGTGVRLDVVLTSPLVRARQTADIVASVFDPHPAIVVVDSLAPGGTHQAVFKDIGKHGRRGNTALVGHEPDLGELAAHLIGTRAALEFRKGGICRIDIESTSAPAGKLRWLLTPKIMRRLRR
jgi:phosphohistidine phosphatase